MTAIPLLPGNWAGRVRGLVMKFETRYEGLVAGTASRNETGAIGLSDHFKLRMRHAATDDFS